MVFNVKTTTKTLLTEGIMRVKAVKHNPVRPCLNRAPFSYRNRKPKYYILYIIYVCVRSF